MAASKKSFIDSVRGIVAGDPLYKGTLKTTGGYSVRILCTDALGPYPIVGLIRMGAREYAMSWSKNGKCLTGFHHVDDLVIK